MPKSHAPKTYHHGNLRSALLEASLLLVKKGGVQNLTLRKAAQLAGVTHAAPYGHFKSKASLIAALKTQGFIKLGEAFTRELQKSPPEPTAKLRALARCYVTFALKHPAYFEIMFRRPLAPPTSDPEYIQEGKKLFHVLSKVITEYLRRTPSRNHRSMETLTIASWALIHGAISLWLDGPLFHVTAHGTTLEKLADQLVETWLHLIRV